MNSEIIVAMLSFIGTLIGTVSGIYATARLSNYRISQLEKKVDKHNNLIERVYLIEQHEAVIETKVNANDIRLTELENEQIRERKI